ncbi:hypothetical protein [Aquibium oceanicum]|uniref:hypothetical protein n=1 Tax=Aquibium oceanicum TaxID=1670800 RepID=UPI000A657AE0|nr:hypothetical protein [Aquibium oceanicum]
MLRFLWRIVRAILIPLVVVVAIPVLGFAYGWLTTSPPPPLTDPGTRVDAPAPELSAQIRREIPGYQRPEESTFLTYPEWSIVYAAREYADFVADRSESDFPYWRTIGRFWQDYAMVVRATEDYPFNSQNHVMLVVIGTSHTIEHAIQSVWENTVGRLTEWAAGWEKTRQDIFQAEVAAEYASFLDQTPWYRFPYAEKRAGLWRLPNANGMATLRSRERKLAFGLAYTIKQAYAGLITAGLAATTDPAFLDIHAWAQGPVWEAIAGEPDTELEMELGDAGVVFVTRRYQVFTDMIPRLIEKGVRFVEIGGNDRIFLTVLSNEAIRLPDGTSELFAYQVPADPALRRTGIVASVPRLHEVLPEIMRNGVRLEHVYDY